MQRIPRWLIITLSVIAVIALILGGGWLWFTRRAFPQTSGAISLKGLSKLVEIIRDENGIPHITAETGADLFFAQGYTHAQERFWEMEFQRRVGSGRLSEILGDATLETDIYLRTLGYRHLAEQEYQQMAAENKAVRKGTSEELDFK